LSPFSFRDGNLIGKDKTHATINRELGLPNDEPTKAVYDFLDALLKNR